MKTIIIATRNKDKFRIASEIFKDLGLMDAKFMQLDDFPSYTESEESGTISERSEQKARGLRDFLEREHALTDDIVIVGIDDGLRRAAEKYPNAYSKEVAQQILAGMYLKKGEEIYISRSYSICLPRTSEMHHVVTEIPFVYVGGADSSMLTGAHYPLSHVLAYKGSTIPVIQEAVDEVRMRNRDESRGLQHVIDRLNYKLTP